MNAQVHAPSENYVALALKFRTDSQRQHSAAGVSENTKVSAPRPRTPAAPEEPPPSSTTILVKRSPSRYFMYADPPSKASRQQRRRDRRRSRQGR